MNEASHVNGAPKRSFLRTILPYCNLIVAVGLTFSLAGVTTRVVSSEHDNAHLEAELSHARQDLSQIRNENQDLFGQLTEETEMAASQYDNKIKKYLNTINALEARLEKMESSTENSNIKTVETVSAFRGELADLRASFRSRPEPKKPVTQVFREFVIFYDAAATVIYTEFDYRRTGSVGGKKKPLKTVTGWGSGFFVTKEGHIATNKHVVQPWKFDADLAAMSALGEIEILKDSLRIACWQSGCQAFDKNGEPKTTIGFNTWKLKNLKIALQAKDSMHERELDYGGFGPTLKIHALDNNDVVLLKAEGTGFHPLPLKRGNTVGIQKLDQVMALGFPRGQNGLEEGKVESSPSIGTVRKVENTIHVTASIIPGNSGGPLIGPDGRVVGIVTRVYSETLGICLKLDHVLKLLEKVGATPATMAKKD